MTDLSGRVDSLEANMSYVDQQLLLRPDMTAFSQYQYTNNQQLDDITDSIYQLQVDLKTVQSLMVNLNIELAALRTTVTGNYAVLTGHMARYATGDSASTHTGGYP